MIPDILALPALLLGILFLYKASDILVEGTSHTAARLGVSSLIISLVIVAFGTSAPEFAISVGAAAQSYSGISLGNIIGSCIANLFLVLGIGAIIRPIQIQKGIIKREMPILILVTLILLIFSLIGLLDTPYNWVGGVLFLLFFVLFIVFFIRCAKKERKNNEKIEKGKTMINTVFIILGIIGVVIGAWLLIESSVIIAEFFNIPELIIALSLVALGTSLPELVVSAMASYKNESDIAVGNVLGSNVFNILLVLGFAALLIPLNANTGESLFHLYVLMAVTLLMIPILLTKYVISRIEGLFMVTGYFIYIFYTFFTAA